MEKKIFKDGEIEHFREISQKEWEKYKSNVNFDESYHLCLIEIAINDKPRYFLVGQSSKSQEKFFDFIETEMYPKGALRTTSLDDPDVVSYENFPIKSVNNL